MATDSYFPGESLLLSQPFIPFAILAYITGHALSFLSSYVVERFAVWRFHYPSQFLLRDGPLSTDYLSSIPQDRYSRARRFVRIATWVFNLPFSALDELFERYLHIRELYSRPLDPHLRKLTLRKLTIFYCREMGVFASQEVEKHLKGPKATNEICFADQDAFRAVYHFVQHNFGSHVPALKNYVALYGFLRTMTLLFTIVFWVSIFAVLKLVLPVTLGFDMPWKNLPVALIATILSGVLAYLFFLAFLKFYKRYTLEALMAMAANYDEDFPEGWADPFAVSVIQAQ